MHSNRKRLTWQERHEAVEHWKKEGLATRHANALADAGYTTMEDLQAATDRDFARLPNVGKGGRMAILEVLQRPRPSNLRTAAETRAQFERAWRDRLGQERFSSLLDEINAMAGADLDRVNHPAARALWELARQRRASSSS